MKKHVLFTTNKKLRNKRKNKMIVCLQLKINQMWWSQLKKKAVLCKNLLLLIWYIHI